MDEHVDRYIPANVNGGWGFAAAVVALAVACIVTVFMIHKATYKHPTDVTWRDGDVTAAPAAPAHDGPIH